MPSGIYKRTQETKNKMRASAFKREPILWKNGRIIRGGYVYIKTYNHPFSGKQNYVAEHRLVMEKHIGRYLTKEETIHHKNDNKKDNRIENLELFASRGQHTRQRHPEIYEKQKVNFKGKHFSPKTEFKKKTTN